MIIDTTLTAVYDGIQQVDIDCKLNTDTKEVFDINFDNEILEIVDNFICFQGFYLKIDGIKYPVLQKEIAKEHEYWYQ